ncbi:MAG: tRNA pseudouridine(55) synthase TruB [Armatimonadota bacterium]
MDGLLPFQKPLGITSRRAVDIVRRHLHQKRAGHAGTLDPEAEGLLLICLGRATRLVDSIHELPKTYIAGLTLGRDSDTQDASGVVLHEADSSHITEADLRLSLKQFTGDIMQMPPMYSACHHNGERLYDLARQGISVERPLRPVTVHRLELIDFTPGNPAQAHIEIECSTGTYIRTLCHDIGQALGCGGLMHSLNRTSIGPFTVESALTEDQLDEGWPGALIHTQTLLPELYPPVTFNLFEQTRLYNGLLVRVADKVPPEVTSGLFAGVNEQGLGFATVSLEDGQFRPVKVFGLAEDEPR